MATRNHHFIYPLDKNGQRTGHTICVLVGSDPVTQEGRVYHGTSLCSPTDQFEYKKGRTLALERALKAEEKLNQKLQDRAKAKV